MLTKSLKSRLLLAVLLVLLCCQTITALWLWHESQEQVQILTQTQLSSEDVAAKIAHEKWESMWAFALPALVSVALSMLIIYGFIKHLTQPLEHLAQDMNQRSLHDLAKLEPNGHATEEVSLLVDSCNRLFERIVIGVEHERQFTADVAHELRTPLAGIRMHLELLALDQAKVVTPLIARIDDLMVLIDQLLQLARASQQQREGKNHFAQIDLVAEVCLPMMREYEWYEHIELSWQLPEEAQCLASAGLLQIALKNVLDNAIKYAGERPVIEVSLKPQNNAWLLQVRDHGQGVDKEALQHLTQPFFRADQRQIGYGVGLSMVKRIAQLHQADLEFEQHEKGGLVVSLILPKQI